MNATQVIVVMGVSGSGKSTVGELVAARVDAAFIDADDYHPTDNVQKMASGIPLTDEDRWPWLSVVGKAIVSQVAEGQRVVVACSALRREYRTFLTMSADLPLTYVHLHGARELLQQRTRARLGHFMPTSLLDSQLATLEPLGEDELGFQIDIADGVESVAQSIVAAIRHSVSSKESLHSRSQTVGE